MCDKCRSIDDQIEHYLLLGKQITDPQTLAAIRHLSRELDAKKQTLHSKE
jgi:hypothetical protein